MSEQLTLVYRASMDEMVETAFRLVENTGEVNRQKWYGLAITPVFFVLMFFILDDSSLQYSLGAFLSILWIPYFLFTYKKLIRKQLRRSLVKGYGSDDSINCQYTLTEKAISFKQDGQEILFQWSSVKNVSVDDEALEITLEPAAVIRIPQRVFTEDGMLTKWLDYIQLQTGFAVLNT